MTLFGTRPEIIRLSLTIRQLDTLCDQVLVHTGQNYKPALSDIFFKELEVRHPDLNLEIKTPAFAGQFAEIIARTSRAFEDVMPDRLIVLGDTNSGLATILAARRGIPTFHLEAGNRCYDDRVPEEINRRIIDHCSTVLMPYTARSKDNLVREGIDRRRIFVVGNPIYEVLNHYETRISKSDILAELRVRPKGYLLATMHRAENVNDPARLKSLLKGLNSAAISQQCPLVAISHPHTADRLRSLGIETNSEHVRFVNALGFFDFVKLEQHARCVLSDSGTVQEECCIFGVPNVTLRDTTERPETIEVGSNILTSVNPDMIVQSVKVVLGSSYRWRPPAEYLEENVSSTVTKIVLGYSV